MPISKAGNGELIYTPIEQKDLFEATGVVRHTEFAVCDHTDVVKQLKFDTSPQATNTTTTIKSGAISSSITLTLPTTTGTLALAGGGGSSNSFATIQPDLGTSPTAVTGNDTLILTSSNSTIAITGTAATDTINFSATSFTGSLTGDVTSTGMATTVSKIQTKTVSGTTGTGNVVFSASPTLTGTLTAATVTASGAVTGSNLSGTNTGDQTITLTSDVTGSGTGSFATTVASVGGSTASAVHQSVLDTTAATSADTASTIVKRSASGNIQVNSVQEGYTTTATAAGTTVFVTGSTAHQYFTGTTTQTIQLPDATTLVLGRGFKIYNRSTGVLTVNDNGSNTLYTINSGRDVDLRVTNIGSANGVWDLVYSALNNATASNTASTIVMRDSSGNFAAGQVTAANVIVNGTGGGGYEELQTQASNPSTPSANNLRLFSDSTGRLSWKRSDGFVRTLDSTLTADRTYTLPDTAGTFTLNAATQTLTNKTLTSPVVSGGSIDNATIGATTPNTGAFTTISATGKVSTAAATTGASSINIPTGVAPTSPNAGDLWSTGQLLQGQFGSTSKTHTIAMTDYPVQGAPMPGAKFLRVAGSNLTAGNNDLYTVPAGKRALFLGGVYYQASGSTITIFPEVKISGTYYRTASNTATTSTVSGTITATSGGGYIAEATEILSINSTGANGLNIWFTVVEFDNTAPMKTVKLLGLASGDQTFYTVPANTSTASYRTNGGTGGWGDTNAIAVCTNGSTPSISGNLVNSGGVVGTGNKVFVATAMTTNAKNSIFGVPTLSAGDFININSSGSDATTLTYLTIMELQLQ